MTPPHRWLKSPTWERWHPLLGATIVGVVFWYFELEMPAKPNYVLAATVTFGAIVSGFVATSLSILIALNSPVMKQIRRTKFISMLQRYLGWALTSGIVLSCTSLFGMWASDAAWYAFVWVSVLVFCLLCLVRLASIILRLFVDPEIATDQ